MQSFLVAYEMHISLPTWHHSHFIFSYFSYIGQHQQEVFLANFKHTLMHYWVFAFQRYRVSYQKRSPCSLKIILKAFLTSNFPRMYLNVFDAMRCFHYEQWLWVEMYALYFKVHVWQLYCIGVCLGSGSGSSNARPMGNTINLSHFYWRC